MTKDEAIHKALKVLNCLNNGRVYETAWVKGAINACEEAIEQPLTRDWKETIDERIARDSEFKEALEQPSQEPVGAVQEGIVSWYVAPPKNGTLLYTHHHQWQGLTDDEIVDWFEECFGHDEISETTMWFAKRLLEAVKEKNHG